MVGRNKKKRGGQVDTFRHGQVVKNDSVLQLAGLVTSTWRGMCPTSYKQEGTSKMFCLYYQDEEVDYCILKKKPEPDVSVVILLLDFKTQV